MIPVNDGEQVISCLEGTELCLTSQRLLRNPTIWDQKPVLPLWLEEIDSIELGSSSFVLLFFLSLISAGIGVLGWLLGSPVFPAALAAAVLLYLFYRQSQARFLYVRHRRGTWRIPIQKKLLAKAGAFVRQVSEARQNRLSFLEQQTEL
jgi:hypothetical protein